MNLATAVAVAPPPNLKQTTDFWDLSKRSVAAQRAGRYVPDRKDDPDSLKAGRTWPDVAGAIIDTYSQPGQCIYAPMCGTGVELVEGIWRNRNAYGVELESHRASRAARNCNVAKADGAPGWWYISIADARQSATEIDHPISLIIIDPPFGETRQDGGRNRFGSVLGNYTGEDRIKGNRGRDQSNIGNMKLLDQMQAMQQVFAQCLQVAADGAYMAVLSKDYRKQFTRIDLLGHFQRAATDAGWRYFDRAVIYLGTASDSQRRNAKANGNLLPITQDLLVFRKGR